LGNQRKITRQNIDFRLQSAVPLRGLVAVAAQVKPAGKCVGCEVRALKRYGAFVALIFLVVALSGGSFAATRDISVAGAPKAGGERRVALVIGNGAYINANRLPNPKNDAKSVAETLKRLGFDVDLGLELTRAQTEEILRHFGDRLQGAKVAVFFYAGHGFQYNGTNYLVPIDAKLESERDLDFEVVDVGKVLHQMEEERRVNLVFLDACRDNPLAKAMARSMAAKGRGMPITRGLAPVDAAAGTLISYATKDGTEASDGNGPHSPYTTALLDEMTTPGLEVGLMLRRVRQHVMAATGDHQVPWDYGSLLGEFYFAGAPAAGQTPPPDVAAAASNETPAPAQKPARVALADPTTRSDIGGDHGLASVVYVTSKRGLDVDSHLIFGTGEDQVTAALRQSGFTSLDTGDAADGKILADTGAVKNSLANHRYVFLVSMSAADQGPHPLNDKIHAYSGLTSLRVYDTSRRMFIYDASTSGNRIHHSPEIGASDAVTAAAMALSQQIAANIPRLRQ
jgi:hypothetical protein